jgi:hypothetical protein
MTGKEFRVLLAESAPGEAADCLRALYRGPHSTLELRIVSTLPTLVATIELRNSRHGAMPAAHGLARPEAIFLDLSLGQPDPLELVVFADIADKSYASRSGCCWRPNYGRPGRSAARREDQGR